MRDIDLEKAKKDALSVIQHLSAGTSSSGRKDVRIVQEVKASQQQTKTAAATQGTQTPREKLQAYLKSIGQQ
jgi:hypothetical protein